MAKKKLAARKAPVKKTAARNQPRQEPKAAVPSAEPEPMQYDMSEQHFNQVVRFVKMASLDRVSQLRQATFDTLGRLGVKRDSSKAVRGLPSGSDQHDLQSLFVWMAKVRPQHKNAVRQVVAIDATCVARSV